MADSDTSTSAGTTEAPADDALIKMISTVNTDGISAVYASGFVLTLACWALGAKIGIVISAIRKL